MDAIAGSVAPGAGFELKRLGIRGLVHPARNGTGRDLHSGGRPVRRLLMFRAILLLTAASAVVSSGGCGIYNPRHGMILRGDWSLEMNRVPWLNSRTQSYDEVGPWRLQRRRDPAAAGRTGKAASRYRGMRVRAAPKWWPTVARRRPWSAAPVRGRMGRAPRLRPPQQVAHSRFHPVPTRPVFTPWNCPTADPGASSPQQMQSPGMQPPRELIPTPAASQSTTQSSRASSQVKTTAWIFKPEEASDQTLGVQIAGTWMI